MRIILRITFALAVVLPIKTSLADISGLPRIIDGDTIAISGERIRLHGIDAPETSQSCLDVGGKRWDCGRQSTSVLTSLIAGRGGCSARLGGFPILLQCAAFWPPRWLGPLPRLPPSPELQLRRNSSCLGGPTVKYLMTAI